MGIYRMGPDWNLLASLDVWKDYSLFVETGTLHGDTTVLAAEHCQKAITIELSEELYTKAKKRFQANENINIIQGSSNKVLEEIVLDIRDNTVFWLDAHWSGGITAGEDYECPVLEEISAIQKNKTLFDNAIIMIDDARFFLTPPTPEHKNDQWPTIKALIDQLDREIYVFEDCIYCVPTRLQFEFQTTLSELAEKNRIQIQQSPLQGVKRVVKKILRAANQ